MDFRLATCDDIQLATHVDFDLTVDSPEPGARSVGLGLPQLSRWSCPRRLRARSRASKLRRRLLELFACDHRGVATEDRTRLLPEDRDNLPVKLALCAAKSRQIA